MEVSLVCGKTSLACKTLLSCFLKLFSCMWTNIDFYFFVVVVVPNGNIEIY